MSKTFLIAIAAATISVAALYTAVTQSDRLKQIEAEASAAAGCKVTIKWRKPSLRLAGLGEEEEVFGEVIVTKDQNAKQLRKYLSDAINSVEQKYLKEPVDVVKLAPSAAHSTTNGTSPALAADTGNRYAVTMKNLKAQPMYAQLFQGFEQDGGDNLQHVAWKIDSDSISGPNEQSDVSWTVQYAMCWGKLNKGEGVFKMTGHAACQLKDKGTLKRDESTGHVEMDITSGGGSDGAITIEVVELFPSGYYCGFGIVTIDGSGNEQAHPTGVVDASAGMITTFTPKQEYSVDFATGNKDMGLYTVSAVSKMEQFDFTGTTFNHATCVFGADGHWKTTLTSDAAKRKLNTNIGTGSDYPLTFTAPPGQIAKFVVEYYQPRY
jgi:hypothetical protein